MNPKIRIGLIGCGKIAKRHVNWFLEHPEAEITALCDPDPDARRATRSLVREKRPEAELVEFERHPALLESGTCDAVAVLLPHYLHFPVCQDALERGHHVLVEKPMVIEPGHAQELKRLTEDKGLTLAIGYQRNTMSEYRLVAKMIARGEFGELQFFSAHLEQDWHGALQAAGQDDSWRWNRDLAGGGQLTDSGSHTLGAVFSVLQRDPESVFAFIETRGAAVDITTVAAVRFQGGLLGSLAIGGFGHSVTEVLRVVGDKKSARIFFRTVNEQALEIDGEIVDAKALLPGTTPNANFIDALHGKAEIRSGPTLGLRVAQLTQALYQSANFGHPITIQRPFLPS